MLSHAAPPFCTPAKCFPGLGNGFTPLQSAFPVWETALHPCKVLSRFGKRLYTLVRCFPNLETILHLLGNCFDKTVIF